MINWDDLRILIAVRDGGSLHAAASILNLDRTTVIRRLNGLEAALGTRLFERGRSGCRLTGAGEEVVGPALAIESAVTSLVHSVGGEARSASGLVSVTMPEFLASHLIIPELPRLKATHPEIDLRIETGYSILNLVRGQADIAIRNRRPEQNTLVSRRLGSAALAFFATNHYLSVRGTPDGSFKGHDLILPNEDELLLPIFAGIGDLVASGKTWLEVNEVATALAAARTGQGIALLPCAAAFSCSDLVAVPPGIAIQTESFLVTHHDLRRQARIKAVMAFLEQVCAEKSDVISGAALRGMTNINQPKAPSGGPRMTSPARA